MTDGKKKYAERAARLSEFYAAKGFKSKVEFAEAFKIRPQHVNAYLTGAQDPVNLCVEIVEQGGDIQYIATGKPFDGSVTLEEKRILSQLKLHNLCTLGHVTRLINIDVANRALYEPKPLPRQIVPRAEELNDTPPEKPKLPDWAEKQLEEKKKAHKHAGKDRDKGK